MSISLSDVAKRAGVSSTAVSHVLNGNKAARIGLATQARIRRVAEEMNYRPNSFARSIARQRTDVLRLISSSHHNPFFVRVTAAIDIATRKAGYKLWVDATLNERWTYGPGEAVGIWPVDGALIWANDTQDLVQYLGHQANEIPVVYLGYQGSDTVDAISMDLYQGGRLAAQHMVECGYRRIGYLSLDATRWSLPGDPRTKAYEDVCRDTGRAVEYVEIDGGGSAPECLTSLDAGIQIAGRPVEQRPDAIICLNDICAMGLCHGLRRGGLRVPEDIAVIGFDGSIEGQCLDIPLTSVSIPVDAMCKAAVDLMVKRIKGDRETPAHKITFQTELIVGGTTRPKGTTLL